MQSFLPVRDDQSPLRGSTYMGGGPPMLYRDGLDAERHANGIGQGSYPDGYLGAMASRRDNRLGINDKSYWRGVHHGERVPLADYSWPDEFNLSSGIRNQAQTGRKFVSAAIGKEPVILVNDGKPGPRDAQAGQRGVVSAPDHDQLSYLRSLAPSWS